MLMVVSSGVLTPTSLLRCANLAAMASNQSILDIAKSRPLDTVANMAIILLKQEDYLLHKLLTSLSEQFLDDGGFKEKMHRMRVERRER